jgi:hypothetical protein
MFVVDQDGFKSFESYVLGVNGATRFPTAKGLLCVLEAVVYVRSTSKATEAQTKEYMEQAQSIWTAVKSLADSGSFASNEQVNDICFALLKVNPYLKGCEDYLKRQIAQAPAPAPVTPSNRARNAADFFAAIDSAKARVQSLTRTKSSVAKIVEQTRESYKELSRRVQKESKARSASHSKYMAAKAEVNAATTFLTNSGDEYGNVSIFSK